MSSLFVVDIETTGLLGEPRDHIVEVGGYYLKGTHSGAGAKKWDIVGE